MRRFRVYRKGDNEPAGFEAGKRHNQVGSVMCRFVQVLAFRPFCQALNSLSQFPLLQSDSGHVYMFFALAPLYQVKASSSFLI